MIGDAVEFNINDHVWVKLTEVGLQLVDQQGFDPLLLVVDGDWSRWQMWELMAFFGPNLTHGSNPPFEMTVRIEV